MTKTNDGAGQTSITVRPRGPFDLFLSFKAAESFLPVTASSATIFRIPVEAGGGAKIVNIRQLPTISLCINATSMDTMRPDQLRTVVKWLICWDLDLRPFYTLVAQHPVMGPVIRSLTGLKPLRPASLFEMTVSAITEQQLSIAAAYHIRARMIRRFGTPVDDLWLFPSPIRLATARLCELRACGLSHQKAKYVRDLARRITEGSLNLEILRHKSDQKIRQALLSIPGFGEWSVEYILSRGFGRPDCLPSTDVGLRRVAGHYFARGRRIAPTEFEEALAAFKPFRGLAAYYLAVHWRLRRTEIHTAARQPWARFKGTMVACDSYRNQTNG